MSTITLESLTEKLKYLPTSILEKIWGYTDVLLENKELDFTLSDEQKEQLLNQKDVTLDECIDPEELYKQLKKKYEL
jgi:hypothetical protein